MRKIIPEEVHPGTSVHNPVDLAGYGWNPNIFSRVVETVAGYDGIDFTLIHTTVAFGLYRGTNAQLDMQTNALIQAKKNLDKPVAVVIYHSGDLEAIKDAFSTQEKYLKAGIPVFPSFVRAARAMSKFVQYYETKEGT